MGLLAVPDESQNTVVLIDRSDYTAAAIGIRVDCACGGQSNEAPGVPPEPISVTCQSCGQAFSVDGLGLHRMEWGF